MDKGKSKILDLKVTVGSAKGLPKQSITGNTMAKGMLDTMAIGKKSKMMKAKGK